MLTRGAGTAPAVEVTKIQGAAGGFKDYIRIARVDHWVKNVFVLPGTAAAVFVDPAVRSSWSWAVFGLAMLAVCLISSSNYVLNEILDAPSDRMHPTKHTRPVAAGRVNVRLGYAEWILLMVAGLAAGLYISKVFVAVLLVLWLMGCIYNIRPIRSKDVPYVDVLSEAINNPLRLLAGWYLTGSAVLPPVTLLLSYWMAGCYFMAIKRFAEFRDIGDHQRSARYRKSFAWYNEQRLLVSIMFYAAHAMLFFGAFLMRYREELILSFPFVALVMAIYLALAFRRDSSVQRPEGLYREPWLMASVIFCAILMITLLFVDVPLLHTVFKSSLPSNL
jgi:decaprenyl-phosphate phosphoribosyltransferase